ncbi:MAG: rod-binding protein [Syntrophomonadales bacterium]
MRVSDIALNLVNPPIPRQLNTPAEKVVGGKGKSAPADNETRLMQACRDFEAIFLGELLKSMRKTVPQGGLLENSFGQDVFQSMLDDEYAQSMALSRSTGLAEILFQQLRSNHNMK